ncbi:DUF4411 family protein [Helicobacter sp. MIT 01-3238]|uniref:DUF4411 family protein n=1 Tax=Helicobacter sp. MIT 01-3238 TaxID=398627 RepID=UPI000E1F0EFD|nr:DUF4411 family protein [Helicobacter sp. MIT 01-3238]RDU53203.1 DUF4411 domain-containing protein [Helicobacter sp. MIT 01-3238]
MKKYLIDTNIFIESANRHYAIDICPGFWDFLIKISKLDNVKSIIQVYDEFTPDDERLKNFRQNLKGNHFFLPIENITPESYNEVTKTLIDMGYAQQAIANFSKHADYFLIALALQENYIIVTQEAKSGNNAKNQIKIPNVCDRLGIECIDVVKFLRDEKAKFVLE